jgi:hypothetical protein
MPDPLRALPGNARTHMSGLLDRASRILGNRPYRDTAACAGTPLGTCNGPERCVLCAIDTALLYRAHGADDAVWDLLRATVGTVKQAALDLIAANPGVPDREAPERICVDLSSRLHNGDLTPRTADEAAERALHFRCIRALQTASVFGQIRATDPDILTSLQNRGWEAGGYVTPAGRFAREDWERAVARHRQSKRS